MITARRGWGAGIITWREARLSGGSTTRGSSSSRAIQGTFAQHGPSLSESRLRASYSGRGQRVRGVGGGRCRNQRSARGRDRGDGGPQPARLVHPHGGANEKSEGLSRSARRGLPKAGGGHTLREIGASCSTGTKWPSRRGKPRLAGKPRGGLGILLGERAGSTSATAPDAGTLYAKVRERPFSTNPLAGPRSRASSRGHGGGAGASARRPHPPGPRARRAGTRSAVTLGRA